MGKKKLKQSKAGSTERRAGKLPSGNMQFAVIREFNGGSRFTALCEDGKNRMVRILTEDVRILSENIRILTQNVRNLIQNVRKFHY